MVSFFARLLLLAAVAIHPCVAARAESVLDHVPEDAIGFAVVRNLSATSAKLEGVAKLFQEVSPQPIPAPLPLIKAVTGLGAGLNEQGDALLALLPGNEGITAPRPLLLAPVSDYAAFAASINGDASGEICRVTIAREEVLVAKRGDYAVLMNVEHRDRLEVLLAEKPQPVASLAPLSEWLAQTDAAAVLTPAGVKMLAAMGQAGLAGQRAAIEQQLSEPEFADTLKQLQQSFVMYEAVLGFLGAEIDAIGAGLAIDDTSNLKLLGQVTLTKEGKLAEVSATPPAEESPLAGYPDEPFVVAGGGPFPPGYMEAMTKASRKMLETFPTPYGFEKFTDKDWQEVEDMWKDAMKGVRGMSMNMLPGDEDEPLYSNIYGIITTDDAEAYLKSYAKSMKKWNELLARTSGDIKLHYETSDAEIAGKKGLLMTADIAEAAADPNVPGVQVMMKAMFGEDGKMRVYMIPATEDKIVMAMSGEEGAAKMVEHAAKGEMGLVESSAMKTTMKLLDPKAPWQAAVSPKGCVIWFKRLMDTMLAQLGGGMPTPDIPAYPDSPPVGLSLNLTEGRFTSEMVWPVDTIKGLAAYIKKASEAP